MSEEERPDEVGAEVAEAKFMLKCARGEPVFDDGGNIVVEDQALWEAVARLVAKRVGSVVEEEWTFSKMCDHVQVIIGIGMYVIEAHEEVTRTLKTLNHVHCRGLWDEGRGKPCLYAQRVITHMREDPQLPSSLATPPHTLNLVENVAAALADCELYSRLLVPAIQIYAEQAFYAAKRMRKAAEKEEKDAESRANDPTYDPSAKENVQGPGNAAKKCFSISLGKSSVRRRTFRTHGKR